MREIERDWRREEAADSEAKRQKQNELHDPKRAGLHLLRAADRSAVKTRAIQQRVPNLGGSPGSGLTERDGERQMERQGQKKRERNTKADRQRDEWRDRERGADTERLEGTETGRNRESPTCPQPSGTSGSLLAGSPLYCKRGFQLVDSSMGCAHSPAAHTRKAPSSMASLQGKDQNVEIHFKKISSPQIPAELNP